AGAEEMDVHIARQTMLRKLEMVVLEVGQGVTHIALASEQFPRIVECPTGAPDEAAAMYIVEGEIGHEFWSDRTGAQLAWGEIEIVDILSDMIRPLVALREAEPVRHAFLADDVDADHFRLLAAVGGKAGNFERLAGATKDPAVAFVEPLGSRAALPGRRPAA